MNYLEMFQTNIFAGMMLLILMIVFRYRLQVPTYRRNILTRLTCLSLLGVIIEPVTWIFDGKQFFGAFFIEYASNFILMLLPLIIAGHLMIYVDYYVYKNINRIKKRYYYMIPAFLTLILLVVNMFYPIYFSVDFETNAYTQGDYYWIQYVILFGLYVYLLTFIFSHWKLIDKQAKIIFILFFALPIIGMGIQILNNRVFFAWTSIAFSIFLMYVLLESTSGDIDYLTKLFSRQSFEEYIDVLMENDVSFGILYIDLNDFKSINDTYGHLMGDRVLKLYANILRMSLKPNKMISRLGGDEFVAVLEAKHEIEDKIIDIQNALKLSENEQMSKLTFSYGYSRFSERASMDKVYSIVDKAMYKYKRKHHNGEK